MRPGVEGQCRLRRTRHQLRMERESKKRAGGGRDYLDVPTHGWCRIIKADTLLQGYGIMVKLILLFGFSACAYAGPFLITGGRIEIITDFHLLGRSLAMGSPRTVCRPWYRFLRSLLCSLPVDQPRAQPVTATNGELAFGGKVYILPVWISIQYALGRWGRFPRASGSAADSNGHRNVRHPVQCGCIDLRTDNRGSAGPPARRTQGCFSAAGTAIVHYSVLAQTSLICFSRDTHS